MKKFISALSSLVLAATAMCGALAFSADAATNTKVDETIISFRSNGQNEVKGEKGKTVPVSIYIPQSSGFHSINLKMAINGKETLGKGSVKDQSGKVTENYKYAFSNYGITIKKGTDQWTKQNEAPDDETFEANKFCLDSGVWCGKGGTAAGNTSDNGAPGKSSQVAAFSPEMFSVSYQADKAINFQAADDNKRGNGPHNIDSYDAWVAAGKPKDLTDYTAVETWTKDEEWAYKTPFISFDLELPADLPDGKYVLDVYTDEYVNCIPSAIYNAVKDASGNVTGYEEVPDDQKVKNKSAVKGVTDGKDGVKTFKTEPLTITVGNPPTTEPTTPSSSETTPTTSSDTTKPTSDTTKGSEVDITNKIIYNLVPSGKKYTAVADNMTGNNKYTATPGEEIAIDWTVKNDQGTAGLQMNFDFSGVTYVSADLPEENKAYRGTPEFNDNNAKTTGEINYSLGGASEVKAGDDKIIYTFKVKAPESGKATIGIISNEKNINKVVPKQDGKQWEFLFHGLEIEVGGPTSSETTKPTSETTVTTSSETTKPSDTSSETTTVSSTSETTVTTQSSDTSKSDSSQNTQTGTVLPGDVNCNGKVQINDVVLLNRYLAKTAQVSDQGLKNAECDGKAGISQDDSSAIQEFLARLIASLPKK